MKKRILLLLLVIALVASAFSLCSCDKDKSPSSGLDHTGEDESTTGDDSETNEPIPEDHSTVTKHKYGSFDYWLYSPDTPDKDLPLIVYLHDESDGGDGIDEMIKKEGLTKILYEKDLHLNAYVLMPNLSGEENSWYGMRSQLKDLVSHVSSAKSIDSSKIYLTGVGEGATGVYEIAMSMPDAFAGFAPVGGEIAGNADVEKLKDVRIMAYVSVDIDEPGSESITDFMFELGKINRNIEIFVLEGYNSSNYTMLYLDREYNLLETLIGY